MCVTLLLLEGAMARLPSSTNDNQGRIIPVEADRRLLTEVAKPRTLSTEYAMLVSVSKYQGSTRSSSRSVGTVFDQEVSQAASRTLSGEPSGIVPA